MVSAFMFGRHPLVEVLSSLLDLPRYSDRYRATADTQPKLQPGDLNKAFFPSELWDIFFNPKTKPKRSW